MFTHPLPDIPGEMQPWVPMSNSLILGIIRDNFKKIIATEAGLSTPLRVSKGTQRALRIISKTFSSPQSHHVHLNIKPVNQKVTFLHYLTSQLHDAKSSEILIRSRWSRKCWYTSRLPGDAQDLAGWQPAGLICCLAQFHLLCYAFKRGGKCLIRQHTKPIHWVSPSALACNEVLKAKTCC